MNEERVELIEQALDEVMQNGTWQRLLKTEILPGPKTTTLLAYELEKAMELIEQRDEG